MRTLPESRMAGVRGESVLISSINFAPSKPGITRSVRTRSMPPFLKRARASSPLWHEITRYPRVSRSTLRMESDCSLSSTQRIVRFGFIQGLDPGHTLVFLLQRSAGANTIFEEFGSDENPTCANHAL